MSTETAHLTLHDIGYRRPILILGACWGAVPALSFGFNGFSTAQGMLAIGVLMTLTLGIIFELDTRQLDQYGTGVPLAWSYALVAPISGVFWTLFGPAFMQVSGLAILGILVGPPASALLYLWQRGRLAKVR